ncbi:MAG: multiheme c-type cytochrome [Candidatus Hodarchaeota archaeon]
MNDQEEILVRQSRWNARRVVLLYWFALIFVGTAAAAGLGSTILSPKYKFESYDHSGITEPWGPQDCLGDGCHDDEVVEWAGTAHSDAVVQYNDTHYLVYGYSITSEASFNMSCAGCMATRATRPPGFPPQPYTYWDPKVTCAACHDQPGTINVNSSQCGNCHTPFGVEQSDMAASAHAESLDDLLASDHKADSCLHCMAGQGLYADASELTLSNTNLTSITCVTCHDPMSAVTGKTQLRADSVVELCGKCHTAEYAMRTGIAEDTIYSPPTGPHGDFDCMECHYYDFVPPHNVSDRFGNEVWYNASFDVNHSFNVDPVPDACARCHAPWETDVNITDITTPIEGRLDALEELQGNISDLLALFEARLENITEKAEEVENLTDVDETTVNEIKALIEEAETLYEFVEDDPSMGFHNPDLAEEKLKMALAKLDEAENAAEEALKEAAAGPGFEWAGVLLAFSILGVLAVLFRKRR